MKKLTALFITGYFLLVSSLGIVAAVPGKVQKAAKENLRREIMSRISCPWYVTENTPANDVKAIVSVDKDGKLSIHEINSANAELRGYVEQTLKTMKVKNDAPVEKFVLVVKFEVM